DERYMFQYLPAMLLGQGDYQWDDLIHELAEALGISLTFSPTPAVYGRPEVDSPLWANMENAAVLLDAVAINTGRTVVRNLDATYALYTVDNSYQTAIQNRANAGTPFTRTAGGNLFNGNPITMSGLANAGFARYPGANLTIARNAILPNRVVVTFPS